MFVAGLPQERINAAFTSVATAVYAVSGVARAVVVVVAAVPAEISAGFGAIGFAAFPAFIIGAAYPTVKVTVFIAASPTVKFGTLCPIVALVDFSAIIATFFFFFFTVPTVIVERGRSRRFKYKSFYCAVAPVC